MCNHYFNDRYENHMELLKIDQPNGRQRRRKSFWILLNQVCKI